MKRILTYKLFEGKSSINEKEVELSVSDIFSDFVSDYNLAIHFDWGWMVSGDPRMDSEIDMIRDEFENSKSIDDVDFQKKSKIYLDQVDKATTRIVQVMFDKYDRSSAILNIHNDGIQSDFDKCAEFVKNYFPNGYVQFDNGSKITEKSWAVRFYIIFE